MNISKITINDMVRSLNSLFAPGRSRALAACACLVLASLPGSAQTCPAPASWFPHSQTPPPNPNLFPGNTTATDCDFHHWAWQTFLYLTQDSGGQPRFLSYPTAADLFPADVSQRPAALASLKARNARPPLRLKVRAAKPRVGGTVVDPDDIFQAGSGGVLVAPDGNPLFYSVHFDETFYDFVESNSYYDYETFITNNPNVTFPPGALELKASWKIVSPGSTLAAYTTKAQVPALYSTNNGVITAGPPMRNVTVALVGLHVVGVVANHPEFIWATFEQGSNAPDLPAGLSPTSGSPVSSSNFTFYAANTPANDCNQLATSYTLNAQSQSLSPVTQVFRQFADGSGVPDNILAIDTLNASVHQQLASTDVWNNYNLIGGVWLLPGALNPGLVPSGSLLHGSPDLANSTMETFVQTPFTNSTPPHTVLTSCLGCHTTTATSTSGGLSIPAMNMNLSHILTDGLVTREAALRKLRAK
jgi:hypothetical protein